MASIPQQRQMLDYIVAKLESSAGRIIPVTRKVVRNTNTNYLEVDDNGLVILVDKKYTGPGFRALCRELAGGKTDVAVVFFKDGTTFFRNAMEANYFKSEHDLSLKHYTPEQMRRMILLSPEEIFIQDRGRDIQYYQPDSERLEEGIETFTFRPARFDYSHISSDRFIPSNADSKRLFIWGDRRHEPGDLELAGNYLIGE